MLTINEIVKTLTATRRDFSEIFLRAQYNIGIDVGNRVEFEAVVRSPDDKQAFKEALLYSEKKSGLFNALLNLIVQKRLDGGNIVFNRETGNASLQAMTNPKKGFTNTLDEAYGLVNGIHWTGKVLINGESKGSGVLIGPKRFLTAWHVVQDMFDVSLKNPSEYIPKTNPPLLEIAFKQKVDLTKRNKSSAPIIIKASDNWNEVFSNCHVEEIRDQIPKPTSDLKGFWDYCVIRMERGHDDDRSWAEMKPNAIVPEDKDIIYLFQFPNGVNAVLHDSNEIVSPDPLDNAIPSIRFLHSSNADHGSSGGPCFDRDFYLFGIHQGVWPVPFAITRTPNDKVINRGIPISQIIEDIEQKQSQNGSYMGTNLDDYFIWYINKESYDPVIGLDDLQFLVLNNIRTEKGRILCIKGEKGLGKTFCGQVIFSLLPDTKHLKLIVPAEMICKLSALEIVKFICAAAGTELKDIELFKNYNSTAITWLRDNVIPELIRQLDAKRNNRTIWIHITNLNIYELDNSAAEFLLAFYECTLQYPWLQFILDGLPVDLPATLSSPIQLYVVKEKTAEDISKYVTRFLNELNIGTNKDFINVFTNIIFTSYKENQKTNKTDTMLFLKDKCKTTLSSLIDKLKSTN